MKKAKRVTPSSLAIVEKGFRGALEEQYGNIVWLSECMRAMGARHNILLCGSAVTTGFNTQQQQSMHIGSLDISTLSDFKSSIVDLLERGARIWVLKEDLDQFNLEFQLIPGIEIADSMATLCQEHDHVWFW